tara:strand:- start:956 stop:1195 length:240 start_codon:yes stop_codon:yes gene_type:complete
MGIKEIETGITFTGDDTYVYGFITARKMLKTEVETELRFRGNTLQNAKNFLTIFGVEPARTRVKVLDQMDELFNSWTEA